MLAKGREAGSQGTKWPSYEERSLSSSLNQRLPTAKPNIHHVLRGTYPGTIKDHHPSLPPLSFLPPPKKKMQFVPHEVFFILFLLICVSSLLHSHEKATVKHLFEFAQLHRIFKACLVAFI